MNDLTTQQPTHVADPFNRSRDIGGMNVGAVAIESERAIAEAQGQLILAKKFPRSIATATADLMEACKSIEFAESAFYTVPNRGSGPSIRFAEECARNYGNFIYGHRELSRTPAKDGNPGKSEIEVYAWDMEKNNRSVRQLTVIHIVDTKYGPKECRDQTDVDNLIANKASKQMRGRILALMPKHMVAAGVAMCRLTMAGGSDKPIHERITIMTNAFAKIGVTSALLETYLGHKLDTIVPDELADLQGIRNAIKEGAKVAEFFATAQDAEAKAATEQKDANAAAITDASKKAAEPKGAAKAAKDALDAKAAATKAAAAKAAKEAAEKATNEEAKQPDAPVEDVKTVEPSADTPTGETSTPASGDETVF